MDLAGNIGSEFFFCHHPHANRSPFCANCHVTNGISDRSTVFDRSINSLTVRYVFLLINRHMGVIDLVDTFETD